MNFADANNLAATLRDTLLGLADHNVIDVDHVTENRPLLVEVAHDRKIQDLTPMLRAAITHDAPERRTGTATLTTLESLIDWTNRNKCEDSALFADTDPNAPSLTCIANYTAKGPNYEDASHNDYRARYAFPLSKEWKRWTEICAEPISKDELGIFVEEYVEDVLNPSPALLGGSGKLEEWEEKLLDTIEKIDGRLASCGKLLEMSRALQIFESDALTVSTDRSTGEQTLAASKEFTDADGKPLKLPNLFLIAIPVFEGGDAYRIPVRLILRKSGPNVRFILSLYRPERAFDDALKGALEAAAEKTGLPLFHGTPES